LDSSFITAAQIASYFSKKALYPATVTAENQVTVVDGPKFEATGLDAALIFTVSYNTIKNTPILLTDLTTNALDGIGDLAETPAPGVVIPSGFFGPSYSSKFTISKFAWADTTTAGTPVSITPDGDTVKFENGKKYSLTVTLNPKTGYTFKKVLPDEDDIDTDAVETFHENSSSSGGFTETSVAKAQPDSVEATLSATADELTIVLNWD
jgi:predicted secreted protein